MLPAGILKNDLNIEVFADPNNFGKCLFIQEGSTKPFSELSSEKLNILQDECFSDKAAMKGLKLMGTPIDNYIEQYNYCNRGAFDSVADMSIDGTTTKEYFDCSKRGRCAGEWLVCC